MSKYPQEAAACRGIHPSLSGWLIQAPCSTRNVTMSTLSSIHAWRLNTYMHKHNEELILGFVVYKNDTDTEEAKDVQVIMLKWSLRQKLGSLSLTLTHTLTLLLLSRYTSQHTTYYLQKVKMWWQYCEECVCVRGGGAWCYLNNKEKITEKRK